MAGEIVKGTVQANIVNVTNNVASPVDIVTDVNGNRYFNEIAGYNLNTDAANILNISDNGLTNVFPSITKLAVEQGKAFVTTQTTFDAGVTSVNVANVIRDRINGWIGAYGNRYDDFILNINPSGANHDVTIVIIRYF